MAEAVKPGYYVVQWDEQTTDERTPWVTETVAELTINQHKASRYYGEREWFICGSEQSTNEEPFRVVRRINVKQ